MFPGYVSHSPDWPLGCGVAKHRGPHMEWDWRNDRWEYRVPYPGNDAYFCIAGTVRVSRDGYHWTRAANPQYGILPGSGLTPSCEEARRLIDEGYRHASD